MITKAASDAAKEVAPPAIVSAATLLGVSLQEWVLWLTLAYAGIRLLCLIPWALGCVSCLYEHKSCPHTCKRSGA